MDNETSQRPFDLGQLARLVPLARDEYREAFARADVLADAGMTARPLRLSHFLAQVCHETAGLTKLEENLHYKAARIEQMGNASPLGSRWRSLVPRAHELAGHPRAFANAVYGGRMGNVGPDDGWRYRGRGLPQLTGRDVYQLIGDRLGLDLVGLPDLAVSPEHMLAIALEVWRWKGCNAPADADDIIGVTKKMNGGLHGLVDRRAWLVKLKAVLLPVPERESDA